MLKQRVESNELNGSFDKAKQIEHARFSATTRTAQQKAADFL